MKRGKKPKAVSGLNRLWSRFSEARVQKAAPKEPTAKNPQDYYWEVLFEEVPEYDMDEMSRLIDFRQKVNYLCRHPLSTRSLPLLQRLYERTEDTTLRSILAKQMYLLRRHYLESYKEYADRALILLVDREKYFDKWEGIYILGCFGGRRALEHAQTRLKKEKDGLLRQTLQRAAARIQARLDALARERGYKV